jgi:hypothetical protein
VAGQLAGDIHHYGYLIAKLSIFFPKANADANHVGFLHQI